MWYKNGKLHRDNDLPAYIYISRDGRYGNKIWVKNDLIHRDNNLPAVENKNGNKEWYKNGKIIYKEKKNCLVS